MCLMDCPIPKCIFYSITHLLVTSTLSLTAVECLSKIEYKEGETTETEARILDLEFHQKKPVQAKRKSTYFYIN